MPRIVRTFWFRSMSFLEQPLFNFWFVRLSARQILIVAISAFVAYVIASGVAVLGLMAGILTWLLAFGVCAGVFVPSRVFPSEWVLLHLIKRTLSSRERKQKRKVTLEPSQPPEQLPLSGQPGEPLKLVGKLTDLSGKPLLNTKFFMDVDGQPYYEGKTDAEGSYSITFVPPGVGIFTMSFKPAGARIEAAKIKLRVGQSSQIPSERVTPPTERQVPKTEKRVVEKIVEPDKYIYELMPSNFLTLSNEKQTELVNNFAAVLNSLEKGVKIYIVKSEKKVDIRGASISTVYTRFYIESQEPIDYILDGAGITYQRVIDFPRPKVVRSLMGAATLEGGRQCKTALLYGLPSTVIEGFCLTDLYPWVDQAIINIRPLPQDEAVRRANNFAIQLSGILYAEAAKSRTPSEEIAQRVQAARGLLQSLVAGQTKLYEFSINLTVGGKDTEELKAKSKGLRAACSAKLISVSTPRLFQDEMVTGKLGRTLFGDTTTVAAFFPFVSSEVIETPGGVFLGINQITGGPVVFDPYLRENTNIAIIGKSGSGKSYASKALLYRLVEQHPNAAFFIIDPEGEYGMPVLQLDHNSYISVASPDNPMGMDPLQVFAQDKSRAVSVLANLLHISPDRDAELYTELRAKAASAGSIHDLGKVADKKLKKYIDALVKGPEGFLVNGTTPVMRERMVFSLKKLHTGLGLIEEAAALNAASLLIFGTIWNYIQQLPVQQPKIVILDEMWLYMTAPASASFVAQLSRRGRKRNVLFFFNSQRPADVLNNDAGRAALENAATKILFIQDESALSLITEKFVLSDIEREMLIDFPPGDALLMSRGTRARVHFWASPEEHRVFTTRPKEMIE